MRRLPLLLLVGCSIHTPRFDTLEPCRQDTQCPRGYRCVEGYCAQCAGDEHCPGPVPDGSTGCAVDADCDDGDFCNGRETCVEGLCVDGEPQSCAYMDDRHLCLVGSCVDGGCRPVPAVDGTPCEDDLYCTGGDACASGVCVAGSIPTCDDENACTTDSCDEDTDTCTNDFVIEGPPGDPTCSDGVDNDCDGATDGADDGCHDPCPGGEGNPCDDGIYCNGPDHCLGGVCMPLGTDACTADSLICTTTCVEASQSCNVLQPGFCLIGGVCFVAGTLNPTNPCQECTPAASTSGWTNDDTNACTNGMFCDSTDACMAGVCTGTGVPPCTDDGLACTTTCDEASASCNVPDPGFCLIGGACWSDGQVDPANPCQVCASAVDQADWSPDDSNTCSDGFSCTTDFCLGGVCTSVVGSCGPGEKCLPQCFGGPTGCGTPPGALSLSCPTPSPTPGTSTCTVTLAGGTTTGQSACLTCRAEAGYTVLGHADFEECAGGPLDGFAASSGTPACSLAGANHYLEASGQTWTIQQMFDTTGYTDLMFCFSYAENGMTTSDTLTVVLCPDGTCAASETLFADTAGPSAGDTGWHRYCFDLDALDPTTANDPNLLVLFTAQSSAAGHLVQIDDVDLRGGGPTCAPSAVALAQGDFTCTGSACGVNGWTVGAGCSMIDPCLGGGLQATPNDTLEVCQTIDLTGTVGNAYLAVDIGENGGDDAASPEDMAVEYCDGAPGAGCTCAPGWQTAFSHEGDLDGQATLGALRRAWVDVTALGFVGPVLGLRLRGSAVGPGDYVQFDNVEVGTIDYACTPASLSVGAISEVGGGDYDVPVDSTAGQSAQLYCVWQVSPPPVEDQVYLEFDP
jgi:hypothetical protein